MYFEALEINFSKLKELLGKWKVRVKIDLNRLEEAYHDADLLKGTKLLEIDLWECKDRITRAFSSFDNVIKHTGASKVLHIFNPELFVMWDVQIREAYGCCGNAEGYFNFLLRSQKEINDILESYSKTQPGALNISRRIYKGREKNITKLFDEYNYEHYTKKKV